jgi:hypothetical protein
MIPLHIAELSVAIAANNDNVVSECPSSDVMKFQAAQIVFQADDAESCISLEARRFRRSLLLATAIPANHDGVTINSIVEE